MAEELNIPLPQENSFLWGHEKAEEEILKASSSGRVHHAWLISGPRGVGKATLAYRLARWLLAGGVSAPAEAADESQGGLFGELPVAAPSGAEQSLAVPADTPVFSQVAAGSHPDLLVVSQQGNEDKVKQEITVDEVRQVAHFLSLTPSQSKWRIVIVDDADSMNRNAANALLKLLEEPPANTLLLLVSHAPGKLLPTIRSRCRSLKLRPLEPAAMERVLAHFMPELEKDELRFALTLAEGSPGVAMQLCKTNASEMYQRLLETLGAMPEMDIGNALSLAQAVGGRNEDEQWQVFSYLMHHLIASVVQGLMTGEWQQEATPGETAVKKALSEKASLDKWMNLWEKVDHIFVDVQRINVERRHSAVCMLEAFRAIAA